MVYPDWQEELKSIGVAYSYKNCYGLSKYWGKSSIESFSCIRTKIVMVYLGKLDYLLKVEMSIRTKIVMVYL